MDTNHLIMKKCKCFIKYNLRNDKFLSALWANLGKSFAVIGYVERSLRQTEHINTYFSDWVAAVKICSFAAVMAGASAALMADKTRPEAN